MQPHRRPSQLTKEMFSDVAGSRVAAILVAEEAARLSPLTTTTATSTQTEEALSAAAERRTIRTATKAEPTAFPFELTGARMKRSCRQFQMQRVHLKKKWRRARGRNHGQDCSHILLPQSANWPHCNSCEARMPSLVPTKLRGPTTSGLLTSQSKSTNICPRACNDLLPRA